MLMVNNKYYNISYYVVEYFQLCRSTYLTVGTYALKFKNKNRCLVINLAVG